MNKNKNNKYEQEQQISRKKEQGVQRDKEQDEQKEE